MFVHRVRYLRYATTKNEREYTELVFKCVLSCTLSKATQARHRLNHIEIRFRGQNNEISLHWYDTVLNKYRDDIEFGEEIRNNLELIGKDHFYFE